MTTACRPIRRRGFSAVEVLVVLGIVIMAVAPVPPLLQKLDDAAARQVCTNNLKQIGLACHYFEGVFKRLPPLYGGFDGVAARNSQKFANVWGSSHVFLLPYLEQDTLYKSLCDNAIPTNVDPSVNGSPGNTEAVSVYVCPTDPSMKGGIVSGGKLGGASYAANAQVFAPLTNEGLDGGQMQPANVNNFTDRGSAISHMFDGSSNTILFIHTYALCGSKNQGSAWGYSAGVGKAPAELDTFQPWSRASYLKQTYMALPGARPFQVQPDPYDQKCVLTDPATPHADVMIVLLGDTSVKGVAPTISSGTWNMACMPNDGNALGEDWRKVLQDLRPNFHEFGN